MCQISDKFKLCTCSIAELEKASAIWQLFMPLPDTDSTSIISGELMLPEDIDLRQEQQNQINILHRLGDADVFDFNPDLKDGALLVLIFRPTNHGYGAREYSYAYRSGKWEPDDKNFFDRQNDYLRTKSGKIHEPS